MKVIYEFYPDEENNDDRTKLKLFQNVDNMYSALTELDNIRRNLNKGYKYYLENEAEETKYSKINVDLLLDDLNEVISEANVWDIP